jgi:uncharacterized protein
MMRHLTPADYVAMPWANGRGTTVEMLRENRQDGGLLLRLSMASVVEDGPFSIFPGVERNLTVISGPGFDLVGATRMTAAPMVPVAFPGDVPIAAIGVTRPSEDFNVMTARALPLPDVRVVGVGAAMPPKGGFLAIFAIAPARVAGRDMAKHDLLITDEDAQMTGGPCVVVGLVTA